MDEYVCELSEELKRVAFLELNETAEKRVEAIKQIRDWVLENPRIIMTRLDSRFILRFLRYRKFDIERTKDSIERWMIMFSVAGFDHNFFSTNFDIEKLHMRDLVRNRFGVLLPHRAHLDKSIINLSKLITFDPKIEGILGEALTLAVLFHEATMDDEEIQIRGATVIEDCSDATIRHVFLLSIPQWFKLLRNLEVKSHRLVLIELIN